MVALTDIFLEDTLLMEMIQAVNTKCNLVLTAIINTLNEVNAFNTVG